MDVARESHRVGVTDEELLRMLREVEDGIPTDEAAEPVEELDAVAPALEVEQQGDPCPHCGEPAENLGDCHVCEEAGCLPPDLWTPGMADCCLTLCVRCARTIHWGCNREDAAGNPTCPTCKF